MMSNAGSAALSLRHGLRGPVFSVVSACAAGSHAIGTALRMIQHGEAEAMVTGAAEAPLTPLSRAAFGSMGAISPTGVSRPFDNRRDGFVMGEGAGVLVLEAGDSRPRSRRDDPRHRCAATAPAATRTTSRRRTPTVAAARGRCRSR